MSETVIKVQNLSKQYRIGTRRQGYKTFREAIIDTVRTPFNLARSLLTTASPSLSPADETIWALRDVSFEVKRGEVVGIIGRNGAGKSTLLKILSKITEPTKGRVELKGRVGSLLEVGTGFHPELTGHENIYLYGAILGMDRYEVTRKFDEIVAFAELEKFVDTPVKRYSSGMYMRLAFAVAAHLEPEILLVDEVLAVGDLAFQNKCMGKMGEVSREGRTVLFVSHNMSAVRNLCTKAVLIDSGSIKNHGDVSAIVDEYVNSGMTSNSSIWVNDSEEEKKEVAWIEKIEIFDSSNQKKIRFLSSESIFIKFSVVVSEANPNLKIGLDLLRNGVNVFRSHHVDFLNNADPLPEGKASLVCQIPGNLLNMGEYYLIPMLSIHCIKILCRKITPVIKFRVVLDTSRSDFHIVYNARNQPGTVFPILEWTIHK